MVPCFGNRQPSKWAFSTGLHTYVCIYAILGYTGDVDISGSNVQYAIKHTFGGLLVAVGKLAQNVCD